jgi:hypothetical protein
LSNGFAVAIETAAQDKHTGSVSSLQRITLYLILIFRLDYERKGKNPHNFGVSITRRYNIDVDERLAIARHQHRHRFLPNVGDTVLLRNPLLYFFDRPILLRNICKFEPGSGVPLEAARMHV